MPKLNFTNEDWARVERDTMAWWEGELDRPLLWLAVTDPVDAGRPHGFMTNYPLSMPVGEVLDRHAPFLEATHFYGDAFPWLWPNFGPGMVAGFAGAQVHSVTEPSETVWFTPAEETSIADLDLAYDPDNVWWRRVQDLTALAVERYGVQLAVAHADLGGNLDILASFREAEGLLFDMVDHPEEVERVASQITELWIRYYDELDRIIRPAFPS